MSALLTASEPHRVDPLTRRFTYDQLRVEFPESNQPSELWDGEIVMSPAPSFRHQKIVFHFQRLLDDWVSGRQLGEVVGAPIDMVLSPHQVVQPDVLFISRERNAMIDRVVAGAADLVAEVTSLGGRDRDRIQKRDLYEQYGVREYWIIDPEAETVDVLFLESARFEVIQRSRPGERAASRLLPGFVVEVAALFKAGTRSA